MCGIAGIMTLDSQHLNPEEVTQMCNALSHRGPDGEGYLAPFSKEKEYYYERIKPKAKISLPKVNNKDFILGHRRLSIIDLSDSANQPLADYSERFWIVFNGEIYNHEEIRAELVQDGYKFRTHHSDTETILNAYSKWGADCLSKFNGAFAFCIWDKLKDEFFLARDRLGIKPLYYSIQNDKFYFSSEVRALLKCESIAKNINKTSLVNYLMFSGTPAPNSIFSSVLKLPPAHFLKIENGKILTPVKYWNPLDTKIIQYSESELLEAIREKFDKSAKHRMLADVNVGVLLSGGIDSSANLAMLSRHTNKSIKAFAFGFENSISEYSNEFKYSRLVAQQFNADYHEIKISVNDFNDKFLELVKIQDSPFTDTANIPIYLLSKLARENNIKVLLGGEGSDELFIGYIAWQLNWKYNSIIEKSPLRYLSPILKRINYKTWYNKSIKEWFRRTSDGLPSFWSGTEILPSSNKNLIFSNEFSNDYKSPFFSVEKLYNEFLKSNRGYYDWMTYSDICFRLPEGLLSRLDNMTMAASVEGRVPFLDHEFVEFTFSIDQKLKVVNGIEKSLLKKAFEGILPNEILHRSKESFAVPLTSMLYEKKYLDLFRDQIYVFNKKNNVFHKDYLEKLLKEKKSSKQFWNLINMSIWFNEYIT